MAKQPVGTIPSEQLAMLQMGSLVLSDRILVMGRRLHYLDKHTDS